MALVCREYQVELPPGTLEQSATVADLAEAVELSLLRKPIPICSFGCSRRSRTAWNHLPAWGSAAVYGNEGITMSDLKERLAALTPEQRKLLTQRLVAARTAQRESVSSPWRLRHLPAARETPDTRLCLTPCSRRRCER